MLLFLPPFSVFLERLIGRRLLITGFVRRAPKLWAAKELLELFPNT